MSEDPIPPGVLSEFDQAFAESSAVLDELLKAHEDNMAQICGLEGLPEAAAIFALSKYLYEDLPREYMASALTVAVVRIHRALHTLEKDE